MKPNGFINCNERKRGILISMNNKPSIRFKTQFVSSLKVIPLYLKCFSSENQSNVRTFNSPTENWPVALGWRIHRLILCKGLRLPSSPNDCSGYNTKQFNSEVLEYSFIVFAPWSILARSDWALWVKYVELNCVLMLNWIAWNWTVLTFKLRTYAKLNCLKWNCFCILNWIVWNGTIFNIETVLTLNWIAWSRIFFIFKCV